MLICARPVRLLNETGFVADGDIDLDFGAESSTTYEVATVSECVAFQIASEARYPPNGFPARNRDRVESVLGKFKRAFGCTEAIKKRSGGCLHAALVTNLPNYASALVTTKEAVDLLSGAKSLGMSAQ